jgi:hypothetical protein
MRWLLNSKKCCPTTRLRSSLEYVAGERSGHVPNCLGNP